MEEPEEVGFLDRTSRDVTTDPLSEDVNSNGVQLRRPGLLTGGCSGSSGSLNSDRSGASTDNVIEEVHTDTPFAGLFRGSSVPMEWATGGPEGGSTAVDRHRPPTYSPPPLDAGSSSSAVGERLSNPLLSPLEEAEEWARVQDIMASFGSGIARESVFMAELEQEFQQRLGLSLSPSQQGLGILANVTKKSFTDDTSSCSATETTTDGSLTNHTSTGDGSSEASTANGSKVQHDEPIVAEYDTVQEWLQGLGLPQYENVFVTKGYDSLDFMNGVLVEADFPELGVSDPAHITAFKAGVAKLPASLPPSNSLYKVPKDLKEWLDSIELGEYEESFTKNGFRCMERVRKMWEVELTMVLEVTKPGHRRRILASLGDRPLEPALPQTLDPRDLSVELSKLNNDICELKEQLFADLPAAVSRERRPPESGTATIRRSGKKTRAPLPPALRSTRAQPTVDLEGGSPPDSEPPPPPAPPLPIRGPSQLAVMEATPGTSSNNSPVTTWKHEPSKLITSSVQYSAQYLGSTHVKELRGTESTMRSIQKLRKSADAAERALLQSAPDQRQPANTVLLAISYTGVRFLDMATQAMICEHEIRNIHCACQDADDLSHFAYITKDVASQGHYCHVFRVDTRDQATDIILTLGEAFEVAYQLAIREQQQASEVSRPSHCRTRSECPARPGAAPTSNRAAYHTHSRSHSMAPRQAVGSEAPPSPAPTNGEGESASSPGEGRSGRRQPHRHPPPRQGYSVGADST